MPDRSAFTGFRAPRLLPFWPHENRLLRCGDARLYVGSPLIGRKTYYQRYTDERGRERQFKVGPADVLTLRQARRKALQIKAEAILGNNPQEERQQRRAIPTLHAFVNDHVLPFVQAYKRS